MQFYVRGRGGDSLKVGGPSFGVHAVARSAWRGRHCTAVAKVSTLLSSSQEDIGSVAAGRGGNVPRVTGMVSGCMLSSSGCTIIHSKFKCVDAGTCWRSLA